MTILPLPKLEIKEGLLTNQKYLDEPGCSNGKEITFRLAEGFHPFSQPRENFNLNL